MTDKMREEFEAWECDADQGPQTCPAWLMYDAKTNTYPLDKIQGRWGVWQASRESLVIELPPVRPEPTSSGDALQSDGEAATWNIWVGDKLAKKECREAIEAAGLKVAP